MGRPMAGSCIVLKNVKPPLSPAHTQYVEKLPEVKTPQVILLQHLQLRADAQGDDKKTWHRGGKRKRTQVLF